MTNNETFHTKVSVPEYFEWNIFMTASFYLTTIIHFVASLLLKFCNPSEGEITIDLICTKKQTKNKQTNKQKN